MMLNYIQIVWVLQSSSIVCSILALEIVVGNPDSYNNFNWTTTDKLCADPGNIMNGIRQPEVKDGVYYKPGTALHYECESSYRLVHGNGKIRCGSDGNWVPSMPVCHFVVCSYPEIPHGGIDVPSAYYYPKFSAKVICNTGYRLLNKFVNTLECQDDGTWIGHNGAYTQEMPRCIVATCPPLSEVHHSALTYNGVKGFDHGYMEGSIAQYSCQQGYLMNGSTVVNKVEVRCHNGDWIGNTNFDCKLVGCISPPLIANGKREIPFEGDNLIKMLTGVDYPVGISVKYWCDAGYVLMASTYIYMCTSEGRWLPSRPPTCEKLDVDYSSKCAKPPSIPFGYVLDNRDTYYPMSKVKYFCESGYRLVGPLQLQCDIDGRWQPQGVPSCERIIDTSEFDWTNVDRTVPTNKETSTSNSAAEPESQMISLVTAGCVLGLLSVILIVAVAYQRKRCSRRFNHVQLQHQINNTTASGTNTHLPPYQDQDRASLIAFADGAHLTLPTYEESIRQRNPLSFGPPTNRSSGRYSRFAVHRNCNHDQTPVGRQPCGRSSSIADSLGSNDTVTPSEVSTTVTVDTLSSHASQTASAASTHAFCGSLASFDTTGSGSILNIEGIPLLEEGDQEKGQVVTTENSYRHQEVV
ncbi:complement component (3d Epstein Barr virus) receptor 2 [Chamberlinius hualienensis]